MHVKGLLQTVLNLAFYCDIDRLDNGLFRYGIIHVLCKGLSRGYFKTGEVPHSGVYEQGMLGTLFDLRVRAATELYEHTGGKAHV